jgi:hypothetical protein
MSAVRHDGQPPQVLPLDEAHRVDLVRVRYPRADDAGYRGIHD